MTSECNFIFCGYNNYSLIDVNLERPVNDIHASIMETF